VEPVLKIYETGGQGVKTWAARPTSVRVSMGSHEENADFAALSLEIFGTEVKLLRRLEK
jgi:hypothetical protein